MSSAADKGPSEKMGITQEDRNKVAQERFGKNFDELDSHQRIQVGGSLGGGLRGGDLADPDRAPPMPEVKFGEDNK